MITQILRRTINDQGHADLSRIPDKPIEDLYRGLLHVAAATGAHWAFRDRRRHRPDRGGAGGRRCRP